MGRFVLKTCPNCDSGLPAIACQSCGTLVCRKCKAPPGSESAIPFAVYCSPECRDGLEVAHQMMQVTCPRCGGSGRNKHTGGECWTCSGTGKVMPNPLNTESQRPSAAD